VASAAAAEILGDATRFDGLGNPQPERDSQDFVALNVFDPPGDHSGSCPRPIPDSRAPIEGAFDNARNCGRRVEAAIGDDCSGTGDGGLGRPFCHTGSWAADAYNGATLTMLVADRRADSNAWCRDGPDHWNSRHVSWSFVPAPDCSGGIRIGFLTS